MKKSILCLGCRIALDNVSHASFTDKISLLDYDIIIITPEISSRLYNDEYYMGKSCASDDQSARLKENSEYWKSEISSAVTQGKTVFVFMSDYKEFYIATGSRDVSGTGRNQKVTRHVGLYDNYKMLPFISGVKSSVGKKMAINRDAHEGLKVFWSEYANSLSYKVKLPEKTNGACVFTKSGDVPVGALMKAKSGVGSIVFLPDLDFEMDEFFDERDEGIYWSEEGIKFAHRLISSVVSFDKSLRDASGKTPEPEWIKSNNYKGDAELELISRLEAIEGEISSLSQSKIDIIANIEKESNLRRLLFEKGKPLEAAILASLRILGFSAENYDDGESEFDAIFESSEGRLIGEAEGKDNKAINVEKLRQLSMNIQEDLEREEVEEPAKPVLFGNGFRLTPLAERGNQFTTKCITAATASNTALIATSSLFSVAFYLSQNPNDDFAETCRKAVLQASGVVEFPDVPSVVTT